MFNNQKIEDLQDRFNLMLERIAKLEKKVKKLEKKKN
jgi:hypothetical protein